MKFSSVALAFNLAQLALSAPIVITRQHTAQAVTVTDTYSTSTNYHTAPTVEILVSDGVTYTYTLTGDATLDQPTTITSVIDDVTPAGNSQTTTLAPTTTEANTQATSTSANADSNNNNNNNNNDNDTTSSTSTPATETTSAADNNNNNNNNQDTSAATTSTSSSALQAPTDIATSIATGTTTSDSGSDSTSTSTSTTATSSSAATSGSLSSVPSAIVYSPYNNDGTCKDEDSVKSDLQKIADTGIKSIRIYGTDCNSITTVLPNALSLGLVVNQGFWFSSSGASSIDDAVSSIISYGQESGWDVFDFITIGNEAVQSGYISVSDLVSKISSVKSKLSDAGYTGKVTTSEPPVTFEENPSLCDADVDFIGINPHSYFDTNSKASTAGSFVKGQVAIVKNVCGDKDIVVTETGYPHSGIQNGGNIPSYANQKIAIADILDKMDKQVTILSTFDDYWKEPGSYGIEQSFGALYLFQ